jgi:nicotinamidase-related amidase
MTEPRDIAKPTSLIEPENTVLLLIDYQPMTIFGVRSHDPQDVISKVTALAKTAKGFGVPTVLTSAGVESIGGDYFPEIRAVFPDQRIYDRTSLNAWETPTVKEAVLATGRPNILMAGLWTEACLAFTGLHAREEGRRVFAVADASGGASLETHERAMQRMIQVGIVPITTDAVLGELQRDIGEHGYSDELIQVMKDHHGNWGQAITYFQRISSLGLTRDAQGHLSRA